MKCSMSRILSFWFSLVLLFYFFFNAHCLVSFELFLLLLPTQILVGKNKNKMYMSKKKEISLNGFKLTPKVQGYYNDHMRTFQHFIF